MDFNGEVSVGMVDSVLPYLEDGLRLENGTSGSLNVLVDSAWRGGTDRPTDYFSWIAGSEVVLKTASGDPFSLTSFQYGTLYRNDPLLIQTGIFSEGLELIVTGNYSEGGEYITKNLQVQGDAWEPYDFSFRWTGLQNVVFRTELITGSPALTAPAPVIDTIVVNGASVHDAGGSTVPESGGSTLALLSCGILSLAWLRRKIG